MSMLDSALSLNEIEQELENVILKRNEEIRVLGDLGLTYEDYKILYLRIRGFGKYPMNLELCEKYSLALVTAGVGAFRYESSCHEALEKIKTFSNGIPQYMKRKLLEVLDNTLREFNLSTYGVHITDVNELVKVMLLHSYHSAEEFQTYFTTALQLREQVAAEELHIRICQKVFPREAEVLDNVLLTRVFTMYKNAYMDCLNNDLAEQELLLRYPNLSWQFISACCKWCHQRDVQGMMKIVK